MVLGTTIGADHRPWSSAVIPVATVALPNFTVIPVSRAPNPEPLTVTEAPGETLGLSAVKVGVTVKVAVAEPVDNPEARIILGPPAT